MSTTFKTTANRSKVYFNGIPVGTIKKIVTQGIEGWRFYPKHAFHDGEIFATRHECHKAVIKLMTEWEEAK